MSERFQPPLRATGHCRHYSYERGRGFLGAIGGPRCAVGCDMTEPLSTRACMPGDFPAQPIPCALRAEYTTEERAAWEAWKQAGMKRIADAIAALPAPLPLGCVGHVECPSCGGTLRWGRWRGGASILCETPGCAHSRFNIDVGADWPATRKGV